MISFFKKLLKAKKLKAKSYKLTRGMTYVELIVVLSIFSILSTVVLFNYKDFEKKVEIRNLASDIALKLKDAQTSAISGKLPLIPPFSTWKPSYGLYFNLSTSKTTFYYFIDLDQLKTFSPVSCPGNECLDKIEIKNGNEIKSIKVLYTDGTSANLNAKDFNITFTRPNSGAIFYYDLAEIILVKYVEITISSPSGIGSIIKVYPSGRIQVN